MSFRIFRQVTLLAVSLGLLGCEGGQPADPVSSPSPAISLTSPDTLLLLPRGWNDFVALNVARSSSITESVSLRCDSVPLGMQVTFAASTLAATESGTRLMVDIDTLMAPGDYTVIVRATADGVAPALLHVRVTVPRPSFDLVVGSSGLSLTQALPTAGTLRFASLSRRNGFRGDITLTFHGLPRGVSPSTYLLREGRRYPAEVVFAGSALPPWPDVGSGTITVHATARDAFDQVFTVPLSVAPAPPELTMSVHPKAIVLSRDGTGRVVLQVSLRPGLTRAIEDIWVAGLPAGVSAATDEAEDGYAALDVRVEGHVLPGTYPLVVHGRLAGTPSGASDASVALSLIVR
jgi:hypothetical protein